MKAGDTVEARVVAMGEKQGFVALRRGSGSGAGGRADLAAAATTGLPVEGMITGVNKGGVEVDIAGVRAFCPLSQLELRPVVHALEPVRVLSAEPPRNEVPLILPDGRLIGALSAAPVGAADMRTVPDVDGVAAAQEDALVALAAVPPVHPCRGRGAVPHHQVDPARVHRNLVLDVAVIAMERLRLGVAKDLAANCEGALLLNRDGRAGSLPLSLRHVAAGVDGHGPSHQQAHV